MCVLVCACVGVCGVCGMCVCALCACTCKCVCGGGEAGVCVCVCVCVCMHERVLTYVHTCVHTFTKHFLCLFVFVCNIMYSYA